MVNASMPLAYSAPTTLPALVPATTSARMPLASSILIAPMWAKPLAAPPPSARPIRSGGKAGADAAGTGADAGASSPRTALPPPQAASAASSTAAEVKRGRAALAGMRREAGKGGWREAPGRRPYGHADEAGWQRA